MIRVVVEFCMNDMDNPSAPDLVWCIHMPAPPTVGMNFILPSHPLMTAPVQNVQWDPHNQAYWAVLEDLEEEDMEELRRIQRHLKKLPQEWEVQNWPEWEA